MKSSLFYFYYKYFYKNLIIYNKENLIEKIIIQGDSNKLNISSIKREKSSYLTAKLKDAIKQNLKFEKLPIVDRGTEFQKRVWKIIYSIPRGKTYSYKRIGNILNNEGYRAIGQACNKNPFPILIPCHRVVASNGIGGFALDIKIKKNLLKFEGCEI